MNKYLNVVGFDCIISVRIREDELKESLRIIKHSKKKYRDLSHFVRCAVIRLNREERARLSL